MANQAQKIAGNVADAGGFVAAMAAAVAYRDAITESLGWSVKVIRNASKRFSLWYHHSLTAHSRRWLAVAFMLNAVFIGLSSIYSIYVLPMDNNEDLVSWFIYWLIGSIALLGALGLRWLALRSVKSLSVSEVKSFLAVAALDIHAFGNGLARQFGIQLTRARIVELIETAALDRNKLRTLLETESGQTIDPDEWSMLLQRSFKGAKHQEKALEKQYGKKGKLGPFTLFLIVFSYGLNALFVTAFASAAYGCGAVWAQIIGLKILGLALGFVCLIAASGALLLITTLAKNVVGYGGALFKGLWDSVLTVLPNIQGEEAKELLPEVKIGLVWDVFKVVAFSLPGKFLIAIIALSWAWPDPKYWMVSVGVVSGLGLFGLTVQAFGNDITESVKKTGRVIGAIGLVMILYRIVQFLFMDGFFGDTAAAASDGAYWWNVFTGLDGWEVTGIIFLVFLYVALVAFVIWAAYRLPGNESNFKYLKMLGAGALLLLLTVVMWGQVVDVADADTSIGGARTALSEPNQRGMPGASSDTDESEEASESPSEEEEDEAEAPSSRRARRHRRRHPSLGVTDDVPPIPPRRSTHVRSPVASGDIPTCESLNIRTPAYEELSREMGRCR